MSLVGWLKPKGESGFGYGSTAHQVTAGLSLEGKTVLVTGCNAGLGLETLRVLTARGVRVVGTARTQQKADAACQAHGHGLGWPLECDLAKPESIVSCVYALFQERVMLDAIVCNAGIMALPTLRQAFGVELQLFTNHIGHFMLVTALLRQLTETGRVVMVSSEAHRRAPREGIQFDNLSGARDYTPWGAYGQSKLANLLFAKELSRRLRGTAQTANAIHPGVIRTTRLWRHLSPALNLLSALADPIALKSIPEGAATQTYVAVHPGAAAVNGAYWMDCNVARPSERAEDVPLAKQLWEVTEELVKRL